MQDNWIQFTFSKLSVHVSPSPDSRHTSCTVLSPGSHLPSKDSNAQHYKTSYNLQSVRGLYSCIAGELGNSSQM